ncbi:putative DNA-binding protein [Bradyrhizobium sp. USDA 10063]
MKAETQDRLCRADYTPLTVNLGENKSFGIVRRSALTAKLHELDPQAYLADVLERIVSGQTKSHQLHELLAWNWKAARQRTARAAA